MVYFIQAGEDGPIKIGKANDPEARLRDLQCAHHEQLYLLSAVGGAERTESYLHGMFADGHIRGEWFRPDAPGLAEFIAEAGPWEARRGSRGGICQDCGKAPVAPRRLRYCAYCGGCRDGSVPLDNRPCTPTTPPTGLENTETPDGIPLGRWGCEW